MRSALVSTVALFLAYFLSLPALSQATVAPAAQTELSKQGISLKVDILAPTAGCAPNVSDILLAPKYAKTLNNFQMIKRGVWTTNGLGTAAVADRTALNYGASGVTNWPLAPVEMIPYNNSIGASGSPIGDHCILIHPNYIVDGTGGGADAFLVLYDLDTSTSVANLTHIGGGGNTQLGRTPIDGMLRVFSANYVVYCPTYNLPASGPYEPSTWDGNITHTLTSGTGSGIPATMLGKTFSFPALVESYAGRAVYGGFKASGSGLQNYVLFSNFLAYSTFTISTPPVATDGDFLAVPLAMGAVTALHPFLSTTGSSVLLVGCENGVCAVVGTDPTNFQMIEITREFGITNNRCFQQIENELYFLATDGLRKFSSNNFTAYSSGFQTKLIQNLAVDSTRQEEAFVTYYASTKELHFFVPQVGDSTSDTDPANVAVAIPVLQHEIILNFNGPDPNDPGGGTQEIPIISTRSGMSTFCACYTDQLFLLGEFIQHTAVTPAYGAWAGIMKGYTGNTYEGTSIPFTFVSSLIPSNSPAQEMSNRKFVIMTEGSDQNFTSTAFTLKAMGNNSIFLNQEDSKTFATGTPPAAPNLATWQSGTTTTYPKLFDFDSRGSGRYWCLKIAGTTSAGVNGIDLVGVQSIMTVGGWRQ